jgi:integrase
LKGRRSTLVRAALALRLVTAQRGGEVLNLRWRDIDGDWWTIPAESSKNELPTACS